ncbi:A24 family peptidase [Paenibacillus sp. GYB003]|uniref:A24 family peptidase n=1 Tax=Paenibacillus sp. GYB003 TaxID=2994392 RepID=UPI002F9695C9
MVACGLAILLVLSFYHDHKEQKIPNRYTVTGTAYGLICHGWNGGWSGLAGAAIGFAAGFGIMLVLYACRAVGAGDVKLFGAIGSIAGGTFVVNGAVNSILFAAVIGIAIVAVRRELAARMRNTFALLFNLLLLRDIAGLAAYRDKAATFPFMYAVFPAMAFTWTYCAPGLT